MYIATGQGRQPQGTKFWSQQKPLVTLVIKIPLKSDFIQFVSWFLYMSIADSPQGTKFWCEQKCLVTSFICCEFKKKKKSLKSDSIQFFNDLMYVYSLGAGRTAPQGTEFLCQQKGLITLTICCKFQRNLFEVWFYTFFFMI